MPPRPAQPQAPPARRPRNEPVDTPAADAVMLAVVTAAVGALFTMMAPEPYMVNRGEGGRGGAGRPAGSAW